MRNVSPGMHKSSAEVKSLELSVMPLVLGMSALFMGDYHVCLTLGFAVVGSLFIMASKHRAEMFFGIKHKKAAMCLPEKIRV